MTVIIGIDPHKATHTAVAIGATRPSSPPSRSGPPANRRRRLLAWAEPFGERTWAIESAGGLGYLLAQQLVDAGEHVLDVPATLASRVRVLGTGKSDKNDPNDALLGGHRRPPVTGAPIGPAGRPCRGAPPSGQAEPGHREASATSWCPVSMPPDHLPRAGGIAKELNASDADGLLNDFEPIPRWSRPATELALELLDDVRRLDAQLKESHKRIKMAVKASGTSLTDVFGIGPILACALIGYTGDVSRFTNRDQFASYDGIAPIEVSSGGRVVHRLSRRGNRQLNHAVHMVAICQIRQTDSEGRAYFERKVAEGKTKREAIRSLKRQICNAVYRHLVLDAQR